MTDEEKQRKKRASSRSPKKADHDSTESNERPATERAEELLGRVRQGVSGLVSSENGREGGSSSATDRADEIVEEVGERVGLLAAEALYRLRVAAERAREEAEDIWAEAQDIHRQWKSRD